MYLHATDVVKNSFVTGVVELSDAERIVGDDHSYQRGSIESRSPCPALNALANQGYIPRDGQNITLAQVEHALRTALHMSPTLARSLVAVLKPLLRKDGSFDLVDTRRHNVIEHDASLTRMDFHQGDNYTFRPEMLEAMIADADGEPVTLKSLAKTFVRRNRESRASGAPRMGLKLWFVSALQAVSPMNTAQTGGKLSREVLHTLFAEERFPDIILNNPQPRTLFGLIANALGMLWHVVVG